ncbi:hypothetical protein MBANPS3_007783 [Mucor bainieri]
MLATAADIATPVPQGGASLMIAFRCHRKNVLVVGHDEIAASRVLSALEADAQVTVVGPLDRMCKELVYRIQNSQVEWAGEAFEEEQLIGNHLVFVSRSDDIELCQDQSLQVAVSTNGLSSVNLANRILQSKISSTLEPSLGEAVKNAGLLRKGAEALDPGSSASLRRYQWLTHICDTKSLEEMSALTATDMSELLASYSKQLEGGIHHL